MHKKIKWWLTYSAVLSLLASGLAGCSDTGSLNDPHPRLESDQNILYSSFAQRPKHLDPARSYSSDESRFIDQIYDPPLQYHYLKRPYELIPNTLQSMPLIRYFDEEGMEVGSDDASLAYSEYELKLQPNIRYQPHPAFAIDNNGQPTYQIRDISEARKFNRLSDFSETGTRTLVAADYAYQMKRLADPARLSPIRGLLSEYMVGMTELSEQLKLAREQLEPGAWLDLDQYEFSGVKVIDDLTLRIRLHGKYPQFKYWLAFHFFGPVPRVVDRFYHQPGLADKNITLDWYPVGTGPYMMTKNDPNEAIVLEKNPNYRMDRYPTQGSDGDRESGLLEDANKPLPFIDKAIYRLEKEAIPLWTKFLQGYYDRSGISSDSFDQAIKVGADGIGLSDEMQAKGISLERAVVPGTYYLGFNMLDPVVGQQGDEDAQEEAAKLRRAVAIAYDQAEMISIFANGRGEVAMGPIPPGIFGYQTGSEGINPYLFDWNNDLQVAEKKSLEEAKQLLAEAGYPDGRNSETGEPLILNLDTTGSGGGSANQAWMIKQFKKIGIQLNIRSTDYNRFKEKMQTGNAQLFQWGWIADYPDAENFLFLLYGPNGQVSSGGSGVNATNYANPEYDSLFEKMKLMEDSPERMAIIQQMLDIIRKDAPWASAWHPLSYTLNNAWVANSKPHGISKSVLKYLKIEHKLRAQQRTERNQPVIWPIALVALVILIFAWPGYLAYRKRQESRIVTAIITADNSNLDRAATGGFHKLDSKKGSDD